MLPPMSLPTMAWITAAILAVYLGGIAYAIFGPRKQRHPEDGMAVGCLTFAAIPAIVVAILVAIGIAWDIPRLVRWPFTACTIIFSYVMLVIIAQPIVRAWKRRP
jgi:peptidoglycan/LPS O-acetylase OafA/YrhL